MDENNKGIKLSRPRLNLQEIQIQTTIPVNESKDEVDENNEYNETYGTEFERVQKDVRNYLLKEHRKLFQEAMFNKSSDKSRKTEVDRVVRNYIQLERKIVPGFSLEDIVIRLWQNIFSLGPLDDALKENSITEIMVNGFDESWVKHKGKDKQVYDYLELENGKKIRIKFDDLKHFQTTIITKILNACNKSVSDNKPIVDARVGECRVSVIWGPISQMKGPILTIRKFPPITLTEDQFLANRTASEEMFDFIKLLVKGGASLCLGGSTGSGKTTTFKLMAGFIKKGERTKVIEDTAEIGLEKIYPYKEGYHFFSEECRIQNDPNTDITIQMLVVAALRQTIKRLIIGEIRKEADLLSAIEASLIGHPLWFTAHGLSAAELAERFVMMLGRYMSKQDANSLLSKSLNIIMMQKHFEEDDKRRVFEITEIVGIDKNGELILTPIFEYDWDTKEFVRKNPISERLVKLFKHAELPRDQYQKYLEPIEQGIG
ncbi:ATPase, T2SS/T4P/T4SS family [Brevibacillus halotolerans]|uniref:ATPase, T2SS/T4P/T4SS family n=1 Tax=Brevibacillus halotolerans TaxID=1507437 RepID=UPI0015EEF941|nr:ATPase, T2SS/T4P/T4SS family [Brevibacillus halotolerans]MBA4533804.1 CpaF family protein [Brevibacillus halotolerans]